MDYFSAVFSNQLDNILSVSATRVQAASLLSKQNKDFNEKKAEDELFYKKGEGGGEF